MNGGLHGIDLQREIPPPPKNPPLVFSYKPADGNTWRSVRHHAKNHALRKGSTPYKEGDRAVYVQVAMTSAMRDRIREIARIEDRSGEAPIYRMIIGLGINVYDKLSEATPAQAVALTVQEIEQA